jgi:hypothetical protein
MEYKLFIEKIRVLETSSVVYEFILERGNNIVNYRGIDDTYQYHFRALTTELFNLIDNQLYSNKLFNEWKIKLFKDISHDKKNIVKSTTEFVTLKITNDLKGNVIFDITDSNETQLYFKQVKLRDFELFIHNLIEFDSRSIAHCNYYSIDKFFD